MVLDALFYVHTSLTWWGALFQDGVDVTGVTVAYTVRAMDAGPIIASERVNVDPNIKVKYSWFLIPVLQQLIYIPYSSRACLE